MFASQFSAPVMRNTGVSSQGADCQSTEGEEKGGRHAGAPALESVSLPHRAFAPHPPTPRTLGLLKLTVGQRERESHPSDGESLPKRHIKIPYGPNK